MINTVKNKIKRVQSLYSFFKWLYFESIAKYKDRKSYIRYKLFRLLKKLSSHIIANEMVGGLITDNGEFYLKMRDGIFLYYNYFDEKYTLGDGQSADIRANQTNDCIENFLMRYMRDGMVYFDIGANNGYFYSLRIARKYRNCKVYAFEPDKKILYHLEKNVAYNGLSNMEIISQGLSNFIGVAQFSANLGSENHILTSINDFPYMIEIDCNTLDNFVEQKGIEKVDVMKVDIEGGEYNFLLGAQKTMKTQKPILFIELNEKLLRKNNLSRSNVISHMENMNYKTYEIIGSNDCLCLPKDKRNILCLEDNQWCNEIS